MPAKWYGWFQGPYEDWIAYKVKPDMKSPSHFDWVKDHYGFWFEVLDSYVVDHVRRTYVATMGQSTEEMDHEPLVHGWTLFPGHNAIHTKDTIEQVWGDRLVWVNPDPPKITIPKFTFHRDHLL